MAYREELYRHVQAFVSAERDAVTEEDTVDSVLVRLRDRGATAIEAIKVVEALFSLDYPAGKIALHACPAWTDVTRSADGVHDVAFEALLQLSEE